MQAPKKLLKVFVIDASLSDTRTFPDNTEAKGKEGYYFTLEVVDTLGKSPGEFRFKTKAVRSYSQGWKQNCQFGLPTSGLGTQFCSLKGVVQWRCSDIVVMMWKMKEGSQNVLGIKRKVSTADQVIGSLALIHLTDITEKVDKPFPILDGRGNTIGYLFDPLSYSLKGA
jgi:hypothetical protein